MIEQQIIRLNKVKELTGLSTSSIWRRETEGTFPLRRHLGRRAVGWLYNEITQWIEQTQQKQHFKRC